MTDFSDIALIRRDSYFWSPDYLEASAWIEHIPFAFWIIEVAKPKMVVELGVHNGSSYFAFCQAIKNLNLNSVIFGVDTWKGDEHAGFYTDETFNKVAGNNEAHYLKFSTLLRTTFDEAKDYFIDGSIELLHIDGFHTYEAVKHDFETWLPKLAENAIVLFHDINVRERGFGVFKFWDELKKQYPHFQFDFGYGLGILCMGKTEAKELTMLCNHKTSEPYYLFLRNLFSDRGAFIKERFNTSLALKKEKERSAILQINHDELSEKLINVQSEFNKMHDKYKNDLIELSEKLNATDKSSKKYTDELSQIQNKIKELTNQLEHQKLLIEWYKNTYENRSLLGTLKEKLKQKKKFLTEEIPASTFVGRTENNYSLQQANSIDYEPTSKQFSCTGEDPYFIIDLNNRRLSAGWYLFSMDITEIEGSLFSPTLYFNCGRNFNESDIWNLPKVKNDKIESLVHFPGIVQQLRFDPSTTECTFRIDNFTLKPLSKLSAFKIAVSLYKKACFSNDTYISFWMRSLGIFLKTGKPTLRKKISDFIYNKPVLLETVSYKNWYKLYDTISEQDIEIIRSLSHNLAYQPLFSVVMPVYNAPLKYLEKAIESVRNQAYTNWELCIADDKSTDKNVLKLLKDYQKKDSRIKVVYRDVNGHISLASNSALELASGDYIVLLDQDDELRPHSLYMVAKAISENKNLQLIYSDEDKIDETGARFDPYFKTDWNKDLFYGQNMISHLGVYKHSIIKKIEGFRQGYEGSQDYDLALRFIEHIQPDQICHIPHVLYHWRAIKGSTAVAVSNKNYAFEAGIKALSDHFKRTGQNAIVSSNRNNSYRIKWPLPEHPPLVSIIIPTRDKVETFATCVKSILTKTEYKNYQVLILDNNSEDVSTHEYYKELQAQYKNIKLYSYEDEFNFSAIINFGVRQSEAEVVVLLNNDTEVINKDWLGEMVSQSLREEIGAVGAKLFYPNDQIQHAGVFLHEGHPGNHIYLKRTKDDPGYFNKLNLVQNYCAVTAACLVIRKEVFLKAGGLDEENLKVAYNDVDFCLKVRELGYNNLWTPFAQLYHHESLSRGSDMSEKNWLRFKKEQSYMLSKWKDLVSKDPYFNPNLDINTNTTRYAFPPDVKYEWQEIKLNEIHLANRTA
jgi:GT2 family glycosyltransferase